MKKIKKKNLEKITENNQDVESFRCGETNYVAIKDVRKFKKICKKFDIIVKKQKKSKNIYKMILKGELASLWACVDLVDEVYFKLNGHHNKSQKCNTAFDLIYDTLEKDERILFSYFENEPKWGMVVNSLTIDSNGDKLVNCMLMKD